MRHIIILIFLSLINISISGQTFIGKSTDKMTNYKVLLRINKDNTVNFIYHLKDNVIYAEYLGKITQKNDSLFHINASMTVGQFFMKSWTTDTIYIVLDPSIARQLEEILITYSNGNVKKLSDFDKEGELRKLVKIPVDSNQFNNSRNANFITLSIDRKNSITGKFLTFKIPYRSAASFTNEGKLEFDIIIKNGIVRSIGRQINQPGNFKLIKKSGT